MKHFQRGGSDRKEEEKKPEGDLLDLEIWGGEEGVKLISIIQREEESTVSNRSSSSNFKSKSIGTSRFILSHFKNAHMLWIYIFFGGSRNKM